MTRLVLHLDRDDAMGIACIPLLDPRRLALQARDGGRLEVVRCVQGWHKREIDLVSRRQIARGLAGVGELAAFEVAKMSDIVRGLIPAGAGEGRVPGGMATFALGRFLQDRFGHKCGLGGCP
jgi:hypothetical protein